VAFSCILLVKANGPYFSITWSRLLCGYVGATVACLLIAGLFSYVSPEHMAQWLDRRDQEQKEAVRRQAQSR
jgi:hypothetical protein